MAKGAIAKTYVESKIKEIFGKNYVGTDGSKIYVYAPEGGEMIQICLSMTCPKNIFSAGDAAPVKNSAPAAWDGMSANPTSVEKIEITQAEQDKVRSLLEELGF